MACQDFASRAQSSYTIVPEMLPKLHRHPALPHHSYSLQNNPVAILSSPHSNQSTLNDDPSPAFDFGQNCFHQQQMQYINHNSQKNASLFYIQYHTSLSVPQIHSSEKMTNSLQGFSRPSCTPPRESDSFSCYIADHQEFLSPQCSQNLSVRPPSTNFSSQHYGDEKIFHTRSAPPTLPSYINNRITLNNNIPCTNPSSNCPYDIRVCTKENMSSPYPPSNSQSHVRVTSHQFNHSHHQLSHPNHHISSQSQSSNRTCLSFSRKMVKPSQLDLARQVCVFT